MKAVSDLYAPVSGEVIEVNSAVADNVQLLADDPYDKGWLIKLKHRRSVGHRRPVDFAAYEKKVAEEAH